MSEHERLKTIHLFTRLYRCYHTRMRDRVEGRITVLESAISLYSPPPPPPLLILPLLILHHLLLLLLLVLLLLTKCDEFSKKHHLHHNHHHQHHHHHIHCWLLCSEEV